MIQFLFVAPPDLLNRVKQEAKKRKISAGELIRTALKQVLLESEKPSV